MKDNTATIIGALVTFCCICPIVYCLICKYCGDDDEEHDSMEERVEHEVTTVTTTTVHQDGDHRGKHSSSDYSGSSDCSDSDDNQKRGAG